jgi:DNA invertase Pin-like site-specific DNA recombinase
MTAGPRRLDRAGVTLMRGRVVGYVRLSRASNGHGIDAQRRSIEEHCRRNGWELLDIFEDEAASGRSTRKRPGLADAVRMCLTGKADAIVASRVDRLARSSLDFARLIAEAQRRGFNLVCAEQGFDLRTPEGKFLASVLGATAEFEADLISARTKAGLEGARRKGRYAGNPAFGRVPDDVRARIRDLRAEGMGLGRIAGTLNADGVPTVRGGRWTKGTIARIVKSGTRSD